MRYYLDTEFNGFGGALMSLALVAEDGASLYLVYSSPKDMTPWVAQNVEPVLFNLPPRCIAHTIGHGDGAFLISNFFDEHGGPADTPEIIANWPEDFRCFCQAIVTGPGQMVSMVNVNMRLIRELASAPALPDSTPHNALWDAFALRELVQPGSWAMDLQLAASRMSPEQISASQRATDRAKAVLKYGDRLQVEYGCSNRIINVRFIGWDGVWICCPSYNDIHANWVRKVNGVPISFRDPP